MNDDLAPFAQLLFCIALMPLALPLAKLVYAVYVRLAAWALVRRQLAIAYDLGVDELALAACGTHRQQLELLDTKLQEHEYLQLVRPKAGRTRTLRAHRRWVNEWLWYAPK